MDQGRSHDRGTLLGPSEGIRLPGFTAASTLDASSPERLCMNVDALDALARLRPDKEDERDLSKIGDADRLRVPAQLPNDTCILTPDRTSPEGPDCPPRDEILVHMANPGGPAAPHGWKPGPELAVGIEYVLIDWARRRSSETTSAPGDQPCPGRACPATEVTRS
ncbi:hypothetical protein GCM10018780_88920 [Streptomyces lanatus]|nr:hypothetical protein GCM10018780_88920 [Streptomyces lanatus]